MIENLQRENVHPLEEAQGFRALLDLPDHQYNVAESRNSPVKRPRMLPAD
jgi:ParB family chromosome partitioning protein